MPQPIKILLADDDVDDLEFISKALCDIGVENKCVYVDSGVVVLQLLEALLYNNDLPSLIVLDLIMPVISGIDILKVLTVDEQYNHIPILILSGSNNPKHERDCLSAGAIAFIKKPYKFSAYESIAWQLHGYGNIGAPIFTS